MEYDTVSDEAPPRSRRDPGIRDLERGDAERGNSQPGNSQPGDPQPGDPQPGDPQPPQSAVRAGSMTRVMPEAEGDLVVHSVMTPALSALGQRKIGEILVEVGAITPSQVQLVLEDQRRSGKRLFGEIAISLGYARRDQVIWALSQQFGYSYSGTSEDAPAHRELVMANAPFSDEVECFRNLRSDLSMTVLSPADVNRPALALVSANIGDGKTFVLSNLAVAFSQARMRTLVIDADMRSPRLHEVFGVDNRIGLSNVLSGRTEMQVIKPVSYLPNLYMLPAGTLPPNPTELIHQPSFQLLLRELQSKFDVVLVDTPASVHGSDAAAIAARCGAALVIARKGKSRVKPLEHLVGRLKKGGVNIAGVMMNSV